MFEKLRNSLDNLHDETKLGLRVKLMAGNFVTLEDWLEFDKTFNAMNETMIEAFNKTCTEYKLEKSKFGGCIIDFQV